jgi:hypothetical protein
VRRAGLLVLGLFTPLVVSLVALALFAGTAHAYLHEATAKDRTRTWAAQQGYYSIQVGGCVRQSNLTVDCRVRFLTWWGDQCNWVVRVTPNLTRGLGGYCYRALNPNYWT